MALSFGFKAEKNALFIVETVVERKGPVFTKRILRRGDFLFPFCFLSGKVIYLFRLICLGVWGSMAIGGGEERGGM